MKKYLFIILLTLAFQGVSYGYEDDMRLDPSFAPLGIEGEYHFFQSPVNNVLDANEPIDNASSYNYGFESSGRSYKELQEGEDMPLFKRCRLILTNKLQQWTPTDSQNNSGEEKKSVVEKLKFWERNKSKNSNTSDNQIPAENGSIAESIQSETSLEEDKSTDTISFETGISEHVTEKELMLDADDVNYDEDTGDMIATGRPSLFLPPQHIRVVADKMIYNQDSNILKGIGNVVVTKDGLPTTSDYIEIDMNEEALYMDNIEALTNLMIMDAEKAIQKNDTLILLNGNFHSDESQVYRMSSRMIGPRFSNMIIAETDQSLFFGDPSGNKINLNIEKLYVDAGKNYDKFTAKGIKVYRKGKYWFTWPSLTTYTDKDRSYFEANYPEFGSKRKLGMFIGPGFTFGGPGGSVMKVIPFLNYQHGDFGFGGALKYRNKFNHTELGYGTSAEIFFLKGLQRLDDNLFFQYNANNFSDEWFLGSRMAKYMAEIYYDKNNILPNFLGENKPLTFRHRASFGLMEDNDRNYYGEKFKSSGTTTTRLRYMAQVSQTLYQYNNPDKNLYFSLNWVLQGSAALYGTGVTQFIAKTGPMVHLQYKRWMQDIGYYQAGYDDQSPMPRYDAYRYGHSSVYLTEIIRLNKYLSVGWSGLVNLSDDAPNGKIFQENRFVFAIGPDDLKVRLGYDFVRRTTYFGFDVAFDTKGSTINYGRMEIKNPERLGKKEKNERKLTFTPAPKPTPQPKEPMISFKKTTKPPEKQLEYAQVINIEDPDKETVD